MKKIVTWLIAVFRSILADFINQIIAAIILVSAYIGWVYSSSIYVAIIVLVTGIILWSILGKILKKIK